MVVSFCRIIDYEKGYTFTMLTPITCLNEIVSVVPDTPRQFQIVENETMGIDPDKAIAARTFTGILLKKPIDDDQQTDGASCKFIEVFYEGGVNITTLFTEELQKQLFKDVQTTSDKPKEPDPGEPATFNPYNNPFNRRKGDINSWN